MIENAITIEPMQPALTEPRQLKRLLKRLKHDAGEAILRYNMMARTVSPCWNY